MAPSNHAQIAMEPGMMIAEVTMAIGAIDRILKIIKSRKTSSALNTLFQILTRERPPSKKLLKSRVPNRNGADPAVGSISN